MRSEEQKDQKMGAKRSREGTTDCHVNSIFVLPCAATSFSQFPTHSSSSSSRTRLASPLPSCRQPALDPAHRLTVQPTALYVHHHQHLLPGAIYTPSSIVVSKSNHCRQPSVEGSPSPQPFHSISFTYIFPSLSFTPSLSPSRQPFDPHSQSSLSSQIPIPMGKRINFNAAFVAWIFMDGAEKRTQRYRI